MELNAETALVPARTIRTTRFGEVSYRDQELFEFRWGLPGFPMLREFVVVALESQKPFVWLQSTERPEVALPLVDPWSIFDDYDPRLPAVTGNVLGIEQADDFCIMCVSVVGGDADEFTVNLLAPVVFNLRTRLARQVMLEDSDYSIRMPIPRTTADAPKQEANSA